MIFYVKFRTDCIAGILACIKDFQNRQLEDLTAIYLLEEDIDPETGIPIGNYLSQYSGNYYFSSFDHWIKEQKYVKYYFRYMDDMVIFGKTKEELFVLKKEIDIYFRNELKLNIKENWQVFPSYVRGIDFLGCGKCRTYGITTSDNYHKGY